MKILAIFVVALLAAGSYTAYGQSLQLVASSESGTTNEGFATTVDVLADAFYPSSPGAINVVIQSPPSHGTATWDSANQLIDYTPAPGFFGIDTFTYYFTYNGSPSNVATVTMTVNQIFQSNQPPTCTAAAISVNQGSSVLVNALANCNDPEGDPLTITTVYGAQHGSTTLQSNQQILYQPFQSYSGPDSFTFEVSDEHPHGTIPTGSVGVTVIPVVNAPVAQQLSVSVTENSAASVTLSATDPNLPPKALTYAIVTQPTHGTLTGTAPNLTYTPTTGYFGSDSFQYKANNGVLDSNIITVPITITKVLFPPAITTSSSTTTNPSQTISGTGDPNVTVKVYDGTTLLGTTTTSSAGTWSFPATLSTGTNTITATEADPSGHETAPSNSITITIPGLPNISIISPVNGATFASGTAAISGTATASGTTIQKVEVSIDGGALTLATGTSSWSYNTASLTAGQHTILAKVTDAVGQSTTSSVSINVLSPPAITTASSTTTNPSQTIAGTGDPNVTIKVYDGTTLLGTTTTSSAGTWSFPATLSTGANTITATEADPSGHETAHSNSITITVNTVTLSPPTITTSSSTTTNPSQTIAGTGDPNVTIKIYDGTALLGTTTTNSAGGWSFQSTLSTGTNTITATEADSSGHETAHSNSITITVNTVTLSPPTITTSSSTTTNPSQTIAGTGDPNVIVKVYDGTTLLGTTTTSSAGTWSFPATLSTGTNTITATEANSSGHETAKSNSITITVKNSTLPSTTTTLTSSANPLQFGQQVTFTAKISPSTATGTVIFTIDGTAKPAVTLSKGTATLSISSLSTGSHTVTAAYSGDTKNSPSTSSALTQTVNKGATTTSLGSNDNSITKGQSVTLTATIAVVSPSTGSPTGTVQFQVNGANFGSPVALSSNKVALTTSSLPVGTDSIIALYSGDTNFSSSSSSSIVVTTSSYGRTSCNGNIGSSINVGFDVDSDDDHHGTQGSFDYTDKSSSIQLHSDQLSFFSAHSGKTMFKGTTSIGNSHNSYNYVVEVTDSDKTGNHDSFSISITDNNGKVVYQKSGTISGHVEIDDNDDNDNHGGNNNNNQGDNGHGDNSHDNNHN